MGLANLGAWLSGLVTLLIETLAFWFGKKAAVVIAASAIFIALLGTLWAAIAAIVATVVVAAPVGGLFDSLWMGFFLFLPSNWVGCAAAMLSADVAVFLYRFHANRIAPPMSGG